MANKKFKVGTNTYIRKLSNPKGSCRGCCLIHDDYLCWYLSKVDVTCSCKRNGQNYIFIRVNK